MKKLRNKFIYVQLFCLFLILSLCGGIFATNEHTSSIKLDVANERARFNVVFDKKSNNFAIAANEHIQIWNALDANLVSEFGISSFPNLVAWNSKQQFIFSTGSKGEVYKWDANSKKLLVHWQAHSKFIGSLECSPDGTLLATTDYNPVQGIPGKVYIWKTIDGSLVRTFDGTKVVFNFDGTVVATVMQPNIQLWEIDDGSLIQTFSERLKVESLAFSPSGEYLAIGLNGGLRDNSGVLYLYSINKAKIDYRIDGLRDAVGCITIDPQGKFLAIGPLPAVNVIEDNVNDPVIQVFRLNDRKMIKRLDGHSRNVWNLDFNSSGDLLASASSDGSVRLWDVSNLK